MPTFYIVISLAGTQTISYINSLPVKKEKITDYHYYINALKMAKGPFKICDARAMAKRQLFCLSAPSYSSNLYARHTIIELEGDLPAAARAKTAIFNKLCVPAAGIMGKIEISYREVQDLNNFIPVAIHLNDTKSINIDLRTWAGWSNVKIADAIDTFTNIFTPKP